MDKVFSNFLHRQRDDALRFNADSDLVQLMPFDDEPQRYVIDLRCKGLIRSPTGAIEVADHFGVAVYFAEDYLRCVANPFQVLTWLGPRNVFHPNISSILPLICIGTVTPGTGLLELAQRVFDVVTYRRVTVDERKALSRAACQWARRHTGLFPIDVRGIKCRSVDVQLQPIRGAE